MLRLAVRRRDLRPRAIAWMRSADSSSSVFGMVLCHRLYAFSLPHDAVQTGSKAAARCSVLRLWFGDRSSRLVVGLRLFVRACWNDSSFESPLCSTPIICSLVRSRLGSLAR